MTEEILINVTPQETRVAVMRSGVVQELHIERAASRGLVGNIYVGRVVRVLPGMQSAFIDIGLERAAFLHVADIWEERRTANGDGRDGAAADRENPGRGPDAAGAGDQGSDRHQGRAPVHADLASPGACWSTCRRNRTSASRSASRTRTSAQARCASKLQQLLPADETGGYIIRTMAETATDDELATTSPTCASCGSDIRERAQTVAPRPSLLYQDLVARAARAARFRQRGDRRASSSTRARTSSRLLAFAARLHAATVLPQLEHYTGERPLFDLYGVEEEIEKALARRVDLKSGGYLIIDQTEAMTTDRRQHRRLRRRAQLRRHHLQDQPRGGAGDRAPAAPAQPRRHHHHRLHRHGEPRSTATRCWPNSRRRWRATARA